MSIAEIKAEIEKLTPDQKKELRDALEAVTSPPEQAAVISNYLGALRGTVIFHPGWDEDEPLEDWEVLRDDDASS